jgi:tRNA-splicing ligase RtcB (3'-phosphate/5'-hydroxy nucleic acid ligase)
MAGRGVAGAVAVGAHGAMRVPGVVFASERLLPDVHGRPQSRAGRQRRDAAGHRGCELRDAGRALGLRVPDRRGGRDRGGAGGVVSPGGVGFDISCGVRLLAAPFDEHELQPGSGALMDALAAVIPRGWAAAGCGRSRPGRAGADPDRGRGLRGLPGHGEPAICSAARTAAGSPARTRRRSASVRASAGWARSDRWGRATTSWRCRSSTGPRRGHGRRLRAARRAGVRDDPLRLAGAGPPGLLGPRAHDARRRCPATASPCPTRSWRARRSTRRRARRYLGALAAAANFARANRQLLTEATRDAFARVTGRRDLRLVYDVSHNLAKIETHTVDGRHVRCVCTARVRRGRSRPDRRAAEDLRAVGQPVLLPGSMGTASYVMVGVEPG